MPDTVEISQAEVALAALVAATEWTEALANRPNSMLRRKEPQRRWKVAELNLTPFMSEQLHRIQVGERSSK
jgi:hypothetical protein